MKLSAARKCERRLGKTIAFTNAELGIGGKK